MAALVARAQRSNTFDANAGGERVRGQEGDEEPINQMPAERAEERYVARKKVKPIERVFEMEELRVSASEDDAQLWEKFSSTSKFCAYCERKWHTGHVESAEHKACVNALKEFRKMYCMQMHKLRTQVRELLQTIRGAARLEQTCEQLQHAFDMFHVCCY